MLILLSFRIKFWAWLGSVWNAECICICYRQQRGLDCIISERGEMSGVVCSSMNGIVSLWVALYEQSMSEWWEARSKTAGWMEWCTACVPECMREAVQINCLLLLIIIKGCNLTEVHGSQIISLNDVILGLVCIYLNILMRIGIFF